MPFFNELVNLQNTLSESSDNSYTSLDLRVDLKSDGHRLSWCELNSDGYWISMVRVKIRRNST